MREKVFQTIYNLIQRGAISAEDAYYIIEAIFEKNNYIYNPSTWATTGTQINTPDRGITDFWDQSTGGVPNITFCTSASSINCSDSDSVSVKANATGNRTECLYGVTDVVGTANG